MNEWVNNLVCPITRAPLYLDGSRLCTRDGLNEYRFENGIASFLAVEERKKWDDYHLSIYSAEPMQSHPYYTRFTDGWHTMLDVGCGDGVMSAGSAAKVNEIYCVNPGFTALQILKRRRIQNMHPINAFGERLPFQDNFFDGIMDIFVIEHILDPLPMLKELGRVLKPEGRLVITTDTAFFYKYLRPLLEWREMGLRAGWKKWKPNDPTHINMMSPSGLRRWLTRAGFQIVEENINYLTGTWERLFGWIPHKVYEATLTTTCTFVCKKTTR